MTDSQNVSLAICILLTLTVIIQRKIIFSWTLIGVFTVSNLIFVLSGVLLLPWVKDLIGTGVFFSGFPKHLFCENDYVYSILLVSGGILIVLFSYHLTYLMFNRGKLLRKPINLLTARKVDITQYIGLSYTKAIIIGSISLLIVWLMVILRVNSIIIGIISMINGDPNGVIIARRAVTNNYLLVLLIYNVIPFFGVVFWLIQLINRKHLFRLYAYFYNFSAIIFLFFTFQKRPLVLYITCLVIAHYWWTSNISLSQRLVKSIRKFNREKKLKIFMYGGMIFMILLILYYSMTNIGRNGEGLLTTLTTLSLVIISRLLGRLSLPVLMYVNYFPNIENHYMLSNIGMLAKILGTNLYSDTSILFEYYYGYNGSVATSSIIDFYGAFGILGWIIGSIALGIGLNRMDSFLSKLPRNPGNIILIIFMFQTALYFSQASIARSMMGYGGIIFISLWFFIKRRSSI